MTMSMNDKPWYRQRWPWLLMLPPTVAIVAGVITTWIAVVTSDGLVEDDYYKQGLAVNQRLARDEAAQRLGVGAELMLAGDGRRLRVLLRLSGEAPAELQLKLAHPTRQGYDQTVSLRRDADGLYSATIEQPINGRRIVILEPPAGDWRLVGDWAADRAEAISLGQAPR